MNEEINRRIEQRIGGKPHFGIERLVTRNRYAERDTSLISAQVTSDLDRQMSEMYDDVDASEAAEPRDAVREFGGLRTRRQFEKHVVEQVSMDMGHSAREAFDFIVPGRSRVFGPPYDLSWAEGSANASSAHLDGGQHLYTLPRANGFSAAGIGFYLTTNEPVFAAITPQGTYSFGVSSFADLPFGRSRGGMGIAIYINSEQQPAMSRQPVLWSLSGITKGSSQSGNGRISDVASPASGSGPVPLAPALLNMVPGSRYLVWVWCWQTSRLEEGDPFFGALSFSMPLVTIDTGPLIFIP